jgi:hypothetical protein
MEPIRARLEDLRHSIEVLRSHSLRFSSILVCTVRTVLDMSVRCAQQFGSMLDTRLDNWLQVLGSYSTIYIPVFLLVERTV